MDSSAIRSAWAGALPRSWTPLPSPGLRATLGERNPRFRRPETSNIPKHTHWRSHFSSAKNKLLPSSGGVLICPGCQKVTRGPVGQTQPACCQIGPGCLPGCGNEGWLPPLQCQCTSSSNANDALSKASNDITEVGCCLAGS